MNIRLPRPLQRMLLDILIVALLYLLVEFARTQEEPVTDWLEWMKAAGFGMLYRVTPELIQILGTFRARTQEVIIGEPE